MDADLTAHPAPLDEPFEPVPAKAAPAAWRRWQVVMPVVLAAAIAAALVLRSVAAAKVKPAPSVRLVPVVVAPVRSADLPVTLTGLGTVVPTDSVTVRTRVDGQLMTVNFREGQMVSQGDLLMQVDPRPFQVALLQAEGQLAKDQAALKNARMDLERYKSLTDQGILPQQQYDTQISTVDQDAAAVKTDQATVENAKLNLVYSRITAPLSGKVGLRMVDAGNMVHATDANGLVVITPVSPIDVVFTIPADQIQPVLEHSKGVKPLPVDAFDRDFTRKLATGTLLAVDNQVDPTTGTVRLKARFANTDGALFPNQFVNARLQVDTLKDALVVPTAAVQRSPKGNFVYVVKADNTVDLHPVEVLLTEGDTIALKGGATPGENVVVDGLDKLSPGIKVAPTAAVPQPKI
jgi:multidrug efflux system membrane fusion protein